MRTAFLWVASGLLLGASAFVLFYFCKVVVDVTVWFIELFGMALEANFA